MTRLLDVQFNETTTAPTGIQLDLSRSDYAAHGVKAWATKAQALAELAAWRDCGRHRERDIEVHRSETWLHWVWVVSRPNNFDGITYLMNGAGEWVPGRLTDASPCWCATPCKGGHTAPWARLQSLPVQPASVTHDYRYSAGSTGVLGGDGKPLMSGGGLGVRPVEVLHWSTQAWCVACTWSTHGSHEESTRLAGRWHRRNPELYPDHATPRRLPRV